ncbi:DoxX family membrane protein [Rothia sp. LK2588]|uniref:DoxX family membrane protein n=1 Tax=Rothia sp. LK2588 TaxID=3114369 RepID=UPI0034D0192B
MSIVRRLARPVLASSFIASGLQRLQDADSNVHIAKAVDMAAHSAPQLAVLRGQERLVGQALAGVQVVAGTMFAFGKAPRLSAAALLASGAINSYIDFQATKAETDEQKKARNSKALAHTSLLGAIALAAVDTDGNPSLIWRANKLTSQAAKKSGKIAGEVQAKTEDLLHL